MKLEPPITRKHTRTATAIHIMVCFDRPVDSGSSGGNVTSGVSSSGGGVVVVEDFSDEKPSDPPLVSK
jgi:hypothetical protein